MAQQVHELKLTNMAAYILEGCMQHSGPCTTPNKIVQWNKVWGKVRAAIDRSMAVPWSPTKIDFETPIFMDDNETEIAFKKREIQFNQCFKAWGNDSCVVKLNDKARDSAREAVKYIIAHKDDQKGRIGVENNNHWACLLVSLGLADDESESEAPSSDQ